MKLLFVGYLHGYGGAEKQITMLANAMDQRKHIVYFIALSENNLCYPLSENIEYEYECDKGCNRIISIIRRFLFLKNKIDEVEPELIIHFNMQSAYFCAIMGGKYASRSIYAERTDPYDESYGGFLSILRKFMTRKVGGFVFQTSGARDFFPEYVKKKCVVINNPIFINPDEFQRNNNPEKRVVSVGRLHKQKNHQLFIKAISKIAKEFSDYRFEIYGDGELKNELCFLIDELGLSETVFLMGNHKDILNRIKDASLFVLSSDYEGMPNTLMEAMVLGIPCISTDCRPGGAKELITDGIEGRIVPCRNEEELSRAIQESLKDYRKSMDMARKGQERIKRLRPEVIYKQWDEFFQSFLE